MATHVDLDRLDRLEREHSAWLNVLQLEESEKARHSAAQELIREARAEAAACTSETADPQRPIPGLGE